MDGKAQRLSEGIVNLFCRLFRVQRLRLGDEYRHREQYEWDSFYGRDSFCVPRLDFREACYRTRYIERYPVWNTSLLGDRGIPMGEVGVPTSNIDLQTSIHECMRMIWDE